MYKNIEGIVFNNNEDFIFIRDNYLEKNIKFYDCCFFNDNYKFPKIIIKQKYDTSIGTFYYEYSIYYYYGNDKDHYDGNVDELKKNNKLFFAKNLIRKIKLKRIND